VWLLYFGTRGSMVWLNVLLCLSLDLCIGCSHLDNSCHLDLSITTSALGVFHQCGHYNCVFKSNCMYGPWNHTSKTIFGKNEKQNQRFNSLRIVAEVLLLKFPGHKITPTPTLTTPITPHPNLLKIIPPLLSNLPHLPSPKSLTLRSMQQLCPGL
jgi:hypothetical protein